MGCRVHAERKFLIQPQTFKLTNHLGAVARATAPVVFWFEYLMIFELGKHDPRGETPPMFLGLDSSTQSLTGVILDPVSGTIICEHSVHFGTDLPQYDSPSGFIPGGTQGTVHANPLMWLDALDLLFARLSAITDLSRIKCIAGSGQQHGSIYWNASLPAVLAKLDPAKSLKTQLRNLTRFWLD